MLQGVSSQTVDFKDYSVPTAIAGPRTGVGAPSPLSSPLEPEQGLSSFSTALPLQALQVR